MLNSEMGSTCPGRVTEVRRYQLLVMMGGTQALFYGFDMARMLKGILEELTLGNMGSRMPTYVRNDNSDAAYKVDSVNTATSEKRINGLLESNKAELEQNSWLIVGYIPGDINATGGLTESLSSANLRILLPKDIFRISAGRRRKLEGRYNRRNSILFALDLSMGK